MKKKLMATLVAVCMVATMIPATALAAEVTAESGSATKVTREAQPATEAKSVAEVEKMITDLKEAEPTDSVEALFIKHTELQKVKEAYSALSTEDQAKVQNANRITSVEASIKKVAVLAAEAEMHNIGKIAETGMTEEQSAAFQSLDMTLKLFGLKGTDLSNQPGFPTYEELQKASQFMQSDQVEKLIAELYCLPEPEKLTRRHITRVEDMEDAYYSFNEYQLDQFKLIVGTQGTFFGCDKKLEESIEAVKVFQLKYATIQPIEAQPATDINPMKIVIKDYKGNVINVDQYEITLSDDFEGVGTLPFKVRAYEASEYEDTKYSGVIKGEFQVVPVSLAKAKAKVTGVSDKTYAGKAITQNPVVKLGKDTLQNGKDYKISYSKNNAIGQATMKITGIGKYTGTINKNFIINTGETKISSLKAGSKQFTVSYKSVKGGVKYQIAYKTTTAKDYKYKTTTSTTAKVTGLSKGKTYKVKVRAYKPVKEGEPYFGKYTSTKTVKVK